jgi:hypothetical protein
MQNTCRPAQPPHSDTPWFLPVPPPHHVLQRAQHQRPVMVYSAATSTRCAGGKMLGVVRRYRDERLHEGSRDGIRAGSSCGRVSSCLCCAPCPPTHRRWEGFEFDTSVCSGGASSGSTDQKRMGRAGRAALSAFCGPASVVAVPLRVSVERAVRDLLC